MSASDLHRSEIYITSDNGCNAFTCIMDGVCMSEISLKHPMQLHPTFSWRTLPLLVVIWRACLAVTPSVKPARNWPWTRAVIPVTARRQKNAPTFEQTADFAKYRGQTDAAARLAGKLPGGHIFGGINAHEQLTEESALTLVRWLIDGIK